MITDYRYINTYKLKAEYYSVLSCMAHVFLHTVYNIKIEEEMMQQQTVVKFLFFL